MKKDFYKRKAKKEGYVARSTYKLKQLNKKYSLIKKKSNVLDLGCWPGGWVQACLEIIGEGNIVGIDLKEVKVKDKRFEFILMDVFDVGVFDVDGKFDVVLSDLAPKTTGIKDLDRGRSIKLAYRALEISRKKLKKHGNFLVKVFQSDEFIGFLNECKKYFGYVKCDKPQASKSKSVEMYVVCKNLK